MTAHSHKLSQGNEPGGDRGPLGIRGCEHLLWLSHSSQSLGHLAPGRAGVAALSAARGHGRRPLAWAVLTLTPHRLPSHLTRGGRLPRCGPAPREPGGGGPPGVPGPAPDVPQQGVPLTLSVGAGGQPSCARGGGASVSGSGRRGGHGVRGTFVRGRRGTARTPSSLLPSCLPPLQDPTPPTHRTSHTCHTRPQLHTPTSTLTH